MRTATALLAPALLLVLGPPMLGAADARAGGVVESVVHDLRGRGPDQTIVMKADAGRLCVEGSDRENYMIFQNDTLYLVDPSQRSVTAIDRQAVQRLAARINPALAELREKLAAMSPEQRKMMESMMPGGLPGGAPAALPVVRQTSRASAVGGRSCKIVEIAANGAVTDELCVVAPGTLAGGQTVYDAAVNMGSVMRQMLGAIDAPWLQQAAGQQLAEYDKIGGFPLSVRHFDGGKAVSETKLTSAKEQAVPAATFEIPSGYRRIDPTQPQ